LETATPMPDSGIAFVAVVDFADKFNLFAIDQGVDNPTEIFRVGLSYFRSSFSFMPNLRAISIARSGRLSEDHRPRNAR
jgi:hypothetical protein